LACSMRPVLSETEMSARRMGRMSWAMRRLLGDSPEKAQPPDAIVPQRASGVCYWPCVDGSPLARVFFEVLRRWSVRPCVRPVDAAHNAAGHNAFREGGSRSKARARGAGPQLGFPVFRFDRLSHYFMFALTNFVSAALICACFYAATGSR
jgi:hypothetical protein